MRIRCGSIPITTTVSLLANEFDVRSLLREQVNLAAVNNIYVFYEVMNSCKNLKIHCFENVNVALCYELL